MQKEQQKYFKDRLSSLEDNERRKLYKRASLVRKLNKTKRRPSEDEVVHRVKSLDDIVLQILLQEDGEMANGPATGQGVVVWLGPKSCRVRTGAEKIECSLTRSQSVSIGDRVTFRPHGDAHAVLAILPRTTVLSRPDADNRNVERVIAANIDVVVVVVSVVAPPLHPRIIDRYMVAIQRGGAKMLLAVNKVDLLDPLNTKSELSKLEPYRSSIAIVNCSTTNMTGIEDLRELLRMMKHMGSTNTMLQTIVDDHMRGRVMSFYAMAMVGSMPIGSFLSGFLAAWIGSAETIFVFSLTSGAATLWFLRSFPRFRDALRPIYEAKGVPQVT